MRQLLFIGRYLKAFLLPYSVWDARRLVHIAKQTGYSYDDVQKVWNRFCDNPDSYHITLTTLNNARLTGMSIDHVILNQKI
ncbi:hypothetical protein GCM10028825_00680 [Spirosoma agri]